MTSNLTFSVDSPFESLTFDQEADSWTFKFVDEIYARASGFWRLFQDSKILFVSLDHGHKFGLTSSLDLVLAVDSVLKSQNLLKIEVDRESADLTLILTGQFKLVIYIASSAYETYDFAINSKRYIGLGSGDIALMDNG